jgi:hypothetical protein
MRYFVLPEWMCPWKRPRIEREHGFGEALANALGLQPGLGPGIIDVGDGEVKFVLVMLGTAALLRAAVGRHPA